MNQDYSPAMLPPESTISHFMNLCIELAKGAAQLEEVPVGAIVVKDGIVVSSGINLRERSMDPCSHAEIIAIRRAADRLGAWRLSECDLYVTLEPCIMCAGALWQSRIRHVYYGAADPKGGAIESLYQINADERINHQYECTGGVLADKSAALLKAFFKGRR